MIRSLLGAALLALTALLPVSASAQATIGAIRFDAWDDTLAGAPGVSTAIALSDPEFQGRAPIHATVTNGRTVHFTYTQAVIDAEINLAADNGLKYWAFLLYSRTQYANVSIGMMKAFDFYQSSTIRNRIKWAAMVPTGLFGTSNGYSVSQLVSWMAQSNYLTLADGRPVLYLYWSNAELSGNFGGSLSSFRAILDQVRSSSQSAIGKTPYVVVLNGAETSVSTALAADAISNYMGPVPNTLNGTFSGLDNSVRNYWTTLANTGVPTVPVMMCGWDRRMRTRRPVPWEAAGQRPFFGELRRAAVATPAEMAAHVQAAVSYINNNPSIVPSKLGLIYAWNEHDEGCGLAATLGDPTASLLRAMKPVIQ